MIVLRYLYRHGPIAVKSAASLIREHTMVTLHAGSIFALVTVLSSACSAPSVTLTDAHALAIGDSLRTTLASYAGSANAADRDSLIRFYNDSPEFLWAANGKIGTRSVSAMRTVFASLAPYKSWHVEYKDPVIHALAPGIASVATEYEQTLADSAGRTITYAGALTMIWVNTTAGWKIVEGHSSSPMPTDR